MTEDGDQDVSQRRRGRGRRRDRDVAVDTPPEPDVQNGAAPAEAVDQPADAGPEAETPPGDEHAGAGAVEPEASEEPTAAEPEPAGEHAAAEAQSEADVAVDEQGWPAVASPAPTWRRPAGPAWTPSPTLATETAVEEPAAEAEAVEAVEADAVAPEAVEADLAAEPAVEEPPVDEVPVEEPPVDEVPVEEPPVDEVPVEEPPVDEVPVEEPPVDEVLVEEAPVEELPVEAAPVEELPVEEPPAEEAPPELRPAPRLEPAGGLYAALWETGLLNVAAIARRELGALFLSPIGYLVAIAVILPTSLIGYLSQVNADQPVSMRGVFNWVAVTMVVLTPLYTMRLLAEEQRSGTLEQLLTSPVRYWEVVLGKWLAGFVFYLATIAFTLVYVVLISAYQQLHTPSTVLGAHVSLPAVDYGAIVTGYVGVALVGAAWVALGLLASSLTQNQIIAAAIGILVLLTFEALLGFVAGFMQPPLSDFFEYASAGNRAQSFNQGQLVLRDVVYFVTLAAGALFVTTRVLESRRWR